MGCCCWLLHWLCAGWLLSWLLLYWFAAAVLVWLLLLLLLVAVLVGLQQQLLFDWWYARLLIPCALLLLSCWLLTSVSSGVGLHHRGRQAQFRPFQLALQVYSQRSILYDHEDHFNQKAAAGDVGIPLPGT